MTSTLLARLEGQLIVSSQAMNPLSPLKQPEILVLLAQAGELGGAGGFRVDGVDVVRLLRPRSKLPIIGIVKDAEKAFDNYITTSVTNAKALVDAGADVVAIQATEGTRPGDSFATIADAVHRRGALVMADIATLGEAQAAAANGADIIATTMVGHTLQTEGAVRPPLDLVSQLVATVGRPVVVEGGVWTPEHVAASFERGAVAVVCGSAITAPDIITERLVSAIPSRGASRH